MIMNKNNMISVNEFCEIHEVETSFIYSVYESGLIELTTIEETEYIPHDEIKELETIVNLCDEMDVNLEGAEIIQRLLKRINSMHDEIIGLKNRLDFYEGE